MQLPKKRKRFFVKLNVYQEDHARVKALAQKAGLSIAGYIHRIATAGSKDAGGARLVETIKESNEEESLSIETTPLPSQEDQGTK